MGSWRRVSLGAVVLLAGCATAGPSAPQVDSRAVTASASAPSGAINGCGSRVETGPLPDWADAGFSGSTRMPHVFGANGEIVAVLFKHPLGQAGKNRANNKILWVARPTTTPSDAASPDTLRITATLDGTGTRVTREVAGGPRPSIIDMPQAGCWHLELRWSGRTDTMDLVYADS